MGFTDSEKPSSFAEQYTLRRENHLTSLQAKEDEMRQKFVMRVKEKESELKEAEREVRMFQMHNYFVLFDIILRLILRY